MRGAPGTPHSVDSADEARQLGQLINDRQRRHPLVVISTDSSGHSTFDAEEAAATLRIHADVWVVGERHSWPLNDQLGSETVFGDAAGVFPPRGEGRLIRHLLTPSNCHSTSELVDAARAAVPGRAERTRHIAEHAVPATRRHASPGLHAATTPTDIDLLAEHLLDPERDRPVAVITTPSNRTEPWIDPQAIVETVGPEAEVHLIRTGPRTFQLTSHLNRMAGVYGGAGRVYDVGQEWLRDPWQSPLRFAYNTAEGSRAGDDLVSDLMGALARSGHLTTQSRAAGRPATGRVSILIPPSRALVQLDDGDVATVWAEMTAPDTDIEALLAPDMRVTGTLDPDTRRIDISAMLRSTEDVAAGLSEGAIVLALVDAVRADAVSVVPFPGVQATVPADLVTGNDLDDLTQLMSPGEVVAARYLGMESPTSWRLSLIDVDDDETSVAIPLIPTGPAWLTPADPEVSEPTEPDAPDDRAEPQRLRAELDKAEKRLADMQAEDAKSSALARRVAKLEAEVRSRDLEVDTLHREVRDSAREISKLNRQIEHERAGKRRAVQKSNKTKSTTAPVVYGFADPEEDMRWAIRRTWVEQTLPSDKAVWPLPEEYGIGADFCRSVDELQGVSRERVLRIVVQVLTGREVPDDHPLRSSKAGGAPAVTREREGATWVCRRAPLQQSSPSARRLSYWRGPGGQIELSRVAVHDDLHP